MVTSEELGRRLRAARKNVGVSQEEAALTLGIPRPAVSQIESGKRSVSGLELARLAVIYRRSLTSFFDDDAADPAEDSVAVLFCAGRLEAHDREVVGEFDALCRNYGELEDILGLEHLISVPYYGDIDEPRDKREAVRQGELVASDERGRMGVGNDPIRDVPDLLDSQGVRVLIRSLHQSGVSGIFLYDRTIGPCILLNGSQHSRRLPFSASREYAHILFDRRLRGGVSTHDRALLAEDGQEELLEIRANSFAAAFLMPSDGIESFLWDRGKARGNGRTVGVLDLLLLQRTFGVSYQAALYRLQNLKWLNRKQREELESHKPDVLAGRLGLDDDLEAPRGRLGGVGSYPLRYVYLALQAYQLGKISLGRLAELLGVGLEDARELVWELGPLDESPVGVEQLATTS